MTEIHRGTVVRIRPQFIAEGTLNWHCGQASATEFLVIISKILQVAVKRKPNNTNQEITTTQILHFFSFETTFTSHCLITLCMCANNCAYLSINAHHLFKKKGSLFFNTHKAKTVGNYALRPWHFQHLDGQMVTLLFFGSVSVEQL